MPCLVYQMPCFARLTYDTARQSPKLDPQLKAWLLIFRKNSTTKNKEHKGRKTISREQEATAKKAPDCAYEVHSCLGPGLLESACQACLLYLWLNFFSCLRVKFSLSGGWLIIPLKGVILNLGGNRTRRNVWLLRLSKFRKKQPFLPTC
jgi:hypothetical protein